MNPQWTVKHGAGTSYPSTTLTNVQSIGIGWGRSVVVDPLASGKYTITGRRPDLLPTIAIDDQIELSADQGSAPLNFVINCRVADFVIHYGIVSSMDTWELVCEDAHAVIGRAQVTTSWAAGNVEPIVNTVTTAAGIQYGYTALAQSPVTVSADSVTNARALDVVQQLYNSYQPSQWIPKGTNISATYAGFAPITIYATDNTVVPSGYLKYSNLEFSGIADNYSPYVVTTSPSLGTVTAGTGTRSYQVSTYNNVSADQSTVAQRLSALLSTASNVPIRVSYTATQQAAATRPLDWRPDWVIGRNVLAVTFRGTTYNTVIIGGSITVTPEDTRVSLNIVPSSWVSAFTLDSSTLGVLGTNRLA